MIVNKLIKNTSFVFISGMANKLFSFFFIAYAARVLGPADFGLYAFIGTVALLFSAFGNFGIVPMAIREISRDKTKVGTLFSHILSLRVGIVLLLYPFLVITINILGYSKEVKYLIYITGISCVFSAFSSSFRILYVAFESFKTPSLIAILVSFFSTTSHIIVLYSGYGLKGIIWVSFLGNLLGAAISGIWIRRKFLKYKFVFNLPVFKDLLLQSLPFAVLFFFQQVTNNINILLLSRLPGPFPGETAMGYYNPPSSVCRNALMFPDSFRQAALPTVSSNAENLEIIKGIVANSTKSLLALVIFPLVLATTFFPEEIINLIFGKEYLPSTPVLTILGWAYALQVFNSPVTVTLSASREIKKFVPWAALEFCMNIALAVPLIMYYSFVGAAIALLVTKVFETFLRNYLLQTIWGIKRLDTQDSLLKILLPMGIIFIVLFLVHRSSLSNVGLLILTLILYFIYILSFRGFRQRITFFTNKLREKCW
ncbi:MAG: flippase [Candidatus Brocadia sp.]